MDDGRNRVGQQQTPQYPMDDAPVIPGGATVGPMSGPASPTWPGSPNAAYEAERYERARKRVKELRGFYASLTSYLSVNLMLFLINLFTSPGQWWFIWPLFGWGIGILFQARHVFMPRFDADWEERKIQQELRKNP